VKRTLIFRRHHKYSGGGRGGVAIVSRGTNFLDDDFHIVFKWNRAWWNNLDWVDDVGFSRNNGEGLDCGGFECNRVILRFECNAGEREDRGDFMVDTMTERLESSLKSLGNREWPHYQGE